MVVVLLLVLLLLLYKMGTRPEEALWNPTTNEIKTLPESPLPFPRTTDPHTYYIDCYGFGFDPASQDYKVIRVLRGSDEFVQLRWVNCQIELYSLKTDSWKITYPYFVNPMQKPSVHINGLYYWAARNQQFDFILPFDFANEKFSSDYIPLPESDKLKGFWNFVIVEFEGSLAALVYADELGPSTEKPSNFEIWVWNDKSYSWSRVSVIDVPVAVAKVVGLFKNDKLSLEGELLLFDCAKRELENLGVHADRKMVDIFPYVGSSVPVNGK